MCFCLQQDVIENTVSRDMAQRFLNFDIKAFVDSNPNIRWCPHPGCGQAVALATPNEDPFDPATGGQSLPIEGAKWQSGSLR